MRLLIVLLVQRFMLKIICGKCEHVYIDLIKLVLLSFI